MKLRRFGKSRVDSAREVAASKRLGELAAGSPLSGKSITFQSRPFPLDTNAYLKAAAGPPAWSARLARIQRIWLELEESIYSLRDERLAGISIPSEREKVWCRTLEGLDLSPLNELIEKHNAYYPVEARLNMEWPSGQYILPAGIAYPMPSVTVESLLLSFPAGGRSPDSAG